MNNDTTRSDAIALVTGANRGIGYAVAAQFAALGMTVLLGCRDRECGERAAAALRGACAAGTPRGAYAVGTLRGPRAAGTAGTTGTAGGDAGRVHVVVLDVTDPASVGAAAEEIDRRFGSLDILVNNAGISGARAEGGSFTPAPSAADPDRVREVFDTNVFGVIRTTNALMPLLLRSPRPRVVNVTSGLGSLTRMSDPADYFAGLPASADYAPSKTALNALTVQYAKELRSTNVLVNAADPGPCATDFTKPLGMRIDRSASDGAKIVVRLATLDSDGPTGQVFNDAGRVPW